MDLIVFNGDSAVSFIRTRAEEIFPGVPVIITGQTLLGYKKADFPATFVSLLTGIDLKRSVDVILQTRPATRKVYLIQGDSEVECQQVNAEQQLKIFAGKVDIIYLNKLPFAKVLETIRTIDGDSVLLFVSYLQDVEKKTFVPAQVMKRVHQEARVPVYGVSDTFIGNGSIGGYMTSNQMVGKAMADLGLDILLKRKLSEVRMDTISVSEYIFDWRELKRWGINLRSLPAGSKVEFRKFTIWEIYKWYILGAITLFFLQVVFIGGLLVNLKKRKQAEVMLQKSETLLNEAQHLTKLGGWEYDVEKSRLTWTDEVYRIHDLSPDSYDPNDVHQNIVFYDSQDRDVITQAFYKAVNQGEPYDLELQFVSAQGKHLWVRTIGHPVMQGGKTVRVVGNIMDITERRRAAEELQQSKERFRTIFEQAPLGIGLIDSFTGQIYEANSKYADIVGVTHEELTSTDWMSITHPDDVQENLDNMARLNAGEIDNFQMNKRYQKQNGTIIWVNMSVVPLQVEDNSLPMHLAMIEDITERKQMEEALRQSEATIRNKLKAITEPEGDIGTLELSDIIDTEVLRSMMDEFYALTGILGAVLDVSGKVLISVGWQDICTKFHRCHPETLKNCIESDTILSSGVPEGTFKEYHCKNNMWDMATPIMVGDQHVGNAFIGQFLYEGETPDVDLFREQARKYGFDETEYLAALCRLPRFDRETVAAGMRFYAKLAGIISKMSFSAIQQSRLFAEHKRVEEEVRKLNAELEQRVAERTTELSAKTAELERVNKVFVGRELWMRELKAQIAELERQRS